MFFQVKKINEEDVSVEDHEGRQFTLLKKFVECQCKSADHFKDLKKKDSEHVKAVL